MKTTLFVLIILLSFFISNTATAVTEPLSGQAKIDSLLAELPNAKGDTNHVNLLNSLSDSYNTLNLDIGTKYGEEALKLASDLNWEIGTAKSYKNLGVNLHFRGEYKKALGYYKEALNIFKKNDDESKGAGILLNIGNVHLNLTDYKLALDYYRKASVLYSKLDSKKGMALANMNIGNFYYYQSEYAEALEYYYKGLKNYEKVGDRGGMSNTLNNMGSVSLIIGDYHKALDYHKSALEIRLGLDDKYGIATSIGNLGIVYSNQENYLKAINHFNKAIEMNIEIGNRKDLKNIYSNLADVYFKQKDYSKSLEYYNQSLEIAIEFKDRYSEALSYGHIGMVYVTITRENVELKPEELNKYLSINSDINLNNGIENLLAGIKILEEVGEKNSRLNQLGNLSEAYKLKGNMGKAYNALEQHNKLKDSIFKKENTDRIAALEKAREDDINRIKLEKQEVQLAAQENEKMFIIYSGIGIIAFVVAILVLIVYQRKKSDKLLYNVLPISIAKRLKKKEHPISDHFEQASILFIDIVGFTVMSKDSDPTVIVQELNKVFTHYDSIATKHGLEKIKTIGDCYMAAAGIPVIQNDNTLRAARMAIEVRDYMIDYYTDSGFKLEVRIGLDCGTVVAGVIGEKKFIYDMWSDAVNTASRMESTGQSGFVHISERFKEAVKDYDEFEFKDRGEMDIKGKGKMKTYFIEKKRIKELV